MKTKTKILKKKKIQSKNSDLITVVLLCDSPGYRMKSYGPVSLVSIGSKRLIDIQIEAIKNVFKNFELVLCVGFDAERVCRYVKSKYPKLAIRIVENQLYEKSNSCEGLRLCLNNICNDKIIVCDGDLLINENCLLNIKLDTNCALTEKQPSNTMEIGFNIDTNNTIQHFSFGAKHIWSEIVYFTGKDPIETLRRILVNYNSKSRFVFEAINELLGLDYNIISVPNKHQIIKINNIKTYHHIRDKNL